LLLSGTDSFSPSSSSLLFSSSFFVFLFLSSSSSFWVFAFVSTSSSGCFFFPSVLSWKSLTGTARAPVGTFVASESHTDSALSGVPVSLSVFSFSFATPITASGAAEGH